MPENRMRCLQCRGHLRVLATNLSAKNPNVLRRRRVCTVCGARYSSLEQLIEQDSNKQLLAYTKEAEKAIQTLNKIDKIITAYKEN